MEATFIACQLFLNTALWSKFITETKNAGGYVHSVIEKMILAGEFDIFHPILHNKNKRDLRFPHSKAKDTYPDLEALADKFRSMTEYERNYPGAKEQMGETQLAINRLLKQNCISIVDPKDRQKVILNPLNLLTKRSGKTQILVHFIGNSCYNKPKLQLDHLKDTSQKIIGFDTLSKTDLSACYWQFKLNQKSSDALCFEFNGVIYRCNGLPYGASSCVWLVQNTNSIVCEYFRSKFGTFVLNYIDDFLVQHVKNFVADLPEFGLYPNDQFPLKSVLKKLGYTISENKTEANVPVLDFCGFVIDLRNKTISIKDSTVAKLKEKIETQVRRCQDIKYILTSELEKLMGLLNFCSATSITGLTQTLELMLGLNYAMKHNLSCVNLTENMLAELDYWKNLYPGSSMQMVRFATFHCTLHVPDETPQRGYSDASSKQWAYKIFGETMLLKSGSGFFDDSLVERLESLGVSVDAEMLTMICINTKEYIAVLILVDSLPWNSLFILLIDNSSVVDSMLKTRSKNRLNNAILKRIFEILKTRSIFARPTWINTRIMDLAGCDDLSRGRHEKLMQNIEISDIGFKFLLRVIPGDFHVVFGHPCLPTSAKEFSYSSFHESNEEFFNGLDPLQHLLLATQQNKLEGGQIILPPHNLIHRVCDILNQCVHQQRCTFAIIVPASYNSLVKNSLRDKLNFNSSKFQPAGKATRLTKSPRQDYVMITFGSDFKN